MRPRVISFSEGIRLSSCGILLLTLQILPQRGVIGSRVTLTSLQDSLRQWRNMYKTYAPEVNLAYCWAEYLLDVDNLTSVRADRQRVAFEDGTTIRKRYQRITTSSAMSRSGDNLEKDNLEKDNWEKDNEGRPNKRESPIPRCYSHQDLLDASSNEILLLRNLRHSYYYGIEKPLVSIRRRSEVYRLAEGPLRRITPLAARQEEQFLFRFFRHASNFDSRKSEVYRKVDVRDQDRRQGTEDLILLKSPKPALPPSVPYAFTRRHFFTAIFRNLATLYRIIRRMIQIIDSNQILSCTKHYLYVKVIKWIDT